jgi:hypothetical protein
MGSGAMIYIPSFIKIALLQLLSTQFMTHIYHTFPFMTCFGLMGPSSGTLDLTSTYFFFCYSPRTGHCLHIGSALYVWSFYALFVVKYIAYGMSKILNYYYSWPGLVIWAIARCTLIGRYVGLMWCSSAIGRLRFLSWVTSRGGDTW